MKTLLYLLLLTASFAHAQPKLEGKVYLYQDKRSNHPLPDVSIKAAGAGSAVTKSTGYYSFLFDKSVNVTTLTVTRIGYEIINQEDLKLVDLKKRQQQNIYLDREGNTEKRKRELLDAALKLSRKRRDNYYAILDKGGAEANKLKAKLELESEKQFTNLDEVRSYIYDKFGADAKILDEVVSAQIRLNLDHSSKDVEKIKRYTLNGNLDSALILLDIKTGFKEVKRNNELIKNATAKNLVQKEKYLSGIPLLLSQGLYSKVDSVYQLAMLADSTDRELVFRYLYFLQKQNQWSKATALGEEFLQKIGLENRYERALFLMLLARGSIISSKNSEIAHYLEEALEIFRDLAEKNPEVYEGDVAVVLSLMGTLSSQTGEWKNAKKLLEEAMGIYKRLAFNRESYKLYMAFTLSGLGHTLMQIDEKSEAKKCFKEAVALCRSWNSKSNTEDEFFVALCFAATGAYLNKIGESIEGKKLMEEGLIIHRRLSSKNPDAYGFYMAGVLSLLGELSEELKEKLEAKAYYEEALEIFRHFAEKNPGVLRSELITLIYRLAKINVQLNQYSTAIALQSEALFHAKLLYRQDSNYFYQIASIYSELIEACKLANDEKHVIKYSKECLDLVRPVIRSTSSSEIAEASVVLSANIAAAFGRLCIPDSAAFYYANALDDCETSMQFLQNALEKDSSNTDLKKSKLSLIGKASWYYLHLKQPHLSEQLATIAIETDTTMEWVKTNLAHALLLQNRYTEAEKIYKFLKNQPNKQDPSRTYANILSDDFQQLTCSGAIPAERKEDIERIKKILME